MAHVVRAHRRLRRLERDALQLWLKLISAQELVYYRRLLRRIERDGFHSVSPEHQERGARSDHSRLRRIAMVVILPCSCIFAAIYKRPVVSGASPLPSGESIKVRG